MTRWGVASVLAGCAAVGAAALAGSGPARADAAAAQRGFAVYSQVCSSCHALRNVAFVDLAGIGLDRAEIRALAASRQVVDGADASGRPNRRAGLPADPVPGPAAPVVLGGAAAPDLARIALTLPGGAEGVRRILLGYRVPPPPGAAVPPGAFWNEAVAGHVIAMPPPLWPGVVTLADGSRPDAAAMARDVAAFLDWTAHPHGEARRRVGAGVVLYLGVLSVLAFLLKRRVWANVRK